MCFSFSSFWFVKTQAGFKLLEVLLLHLLSPEVVDMNNHTQSKLGTFMFAF